MPNKQGDIMKFKVVEEINGHNAVMQMVVGDGKIVRTGDVRVTEGKLKMAKTRLSTPISKIASMTSTSPRWKNSQATVTLTSGDELEFIFAVSKRKGLGTAEDFIDAIESLMDT